MVNLIFYQAFELSFGLHVQRVGRDAHSPRERLLYTSGRILVIIGRSQCVELCPILSFISGVDRFCAHGHTLIVTQFATLTQSRGRSWVNSYGRTQMGMLSRTTICGLLSGSSIIECYFHFLYKIIFLT